MAEEDKILTVALQATPTVSARMDVSDIIELNIVEDIYSFCMYGDITFYDKVGWTEKFEMVGFDPISIIYKTDGIEIKKIFVVYNYEVILEESQKTTSLKKIRWYFVEPLFMALTTKSISKAWGTGVNGATLIQNICKDSLGVTTFKNFESTKETFDNFYIPYWNAAEAIKWIMKRCSGSKSGLPGYLFYSNSQGVNFQTIETMMISKDREMNNGIIIKYSSLGQNANTTVFWGWYINPPDMTSIKQLSGSRRHEYNFVGK